AGTFLGLLIMGTARSLWVIFVARILDGLTAGNISIAQAYIADMTEPQHRTRSFGVIGIAFGIGFFVGPAATGFLSRWGYPTPIFVAAGLSAISIASTALLLPWGPPPHAGNGATSIVKRWRFDLYTKYFQVPDLRSLLTQFFILSLVSAIFLWGFGLFAERRFGYDVRHVGYLFGLAGFLGIILQGSLIGPLVKRFGEAKLVVAGFVLEGMSFILLAFSFSPPPLLAAVAGYAIGNSLLQPALRGSISLSAPQSEQGTIIGMTQSVNSISFIAGPLIAGVLIDRQWLSEWALLPSVLLFAALSFSARPSSKPQV